MGRVSKEHVETNAGTSRNIHESPSSGQASAGDTPDTLCGVVLVQLIIPLRYVRLRRGLTEPGTGASGHHSNPLPAT